jgi:hypothetical protein
VLVDQLHGPSQPLGLGGAYLAHGLIGRYVHAVQDIADVMQHIGGDFRHACLTCGVQQFALCLRKFEGTLLHPLFE